MIRRPPRSTLFPYTTSSDLVHPSAAVGFERGVDDYERGRPDFPVIQDRKSTRLNSSHTVISYAVFCLKKKKHRIPLGATAASRTGGLSPVTAPPPDPDEQRL